MWTCVFHLTVDTKKGEDFSCKHSLQYCTHNSIVDSLIHEFLYKVLQLLILVPKYLLIDSFR